MRDAMSKVTIACVGGFLGAGKTTALQQAARELNRRHRKVGIITNDQGTELVDTHIMRQQGVPTREIVGGCFCCKFDELVEAADAILEKEQPDIILAEAVGSCTDLSATVYQPLRRYYGDRYQLAPLSILVEPDRIRALSTGSEGRFPDSVRYLFERQLAEADLILLNKTDTIDPVERRAVTALIRDAIGNVPVHPMSALTAAGVPEWVDHLLGGGPAGARVLEIDYETYAAAEAALGWLNATVDLFAASTFSPKDVAEFFVRQVQRGANENNMGIAHFKALVAAGANADHIALTDGRGEPRWRGVANFVAADKLSLIINARIRTSPDELGRLIDQSLATSAETFALRTVMRHKECFSPSKPVPVHRMTADSP
jgi:G3E family GTPase